MTDSTFNLDLGIFEEMSDVDAMAVAGGGAVNTLVGTVTSANNAIGNGGTPTTGLVGVVTTTTQATTDYLNKVNGGLEGGFQAINAGVTGLGNDL